MNLKTIVVFFVTMTILCASAFAQDANQPDSLIIGPVQIERGSSAAIKIEFFNDQKLAAITIPLRVIGEGLRIDSVSFSGSRVEYLRTRPITIGRDGQFTVFGAICMLENYISPGKGLLATLYVHASDSAQLGSCYIDTTTIGPATILFTKTNSVSLVPRFISGKVDIAPASK